ncbi:ABC transporter ATP-binding protein [Microbacterium protaetiae]|uniref:ABC transporter ATP-binding protein n=1 Tax=Microbacterium protaetiae TaxID=2509458 RepID=A0A4P6EFG4_9MICO|nr:ABC transporter ATP-binding protein [Microbacterium protaetiae]QAY61014.1 ABC transporter ATP-binding protein [Microbacterium protaetiae]
MKASEPGWVRRLGGYLLRHRRHLVIALSAAALGAACQVATPLVARTIVDDVIVSGTAPLLPWLLLLIALAVLGFGFAYLRRYRGGRIGLDVQNDLRNDMHDRLQGMDAATLATMPTGQLVARANSDTGLVQGLLNFVPMVGGNVLMMALSLIVMFILSPLLAIISLAIVPALIAISYRLRSRLFPASWDGQQKEGELAGIVDEDIAGVRVVKAFGQERRELRRLTDAASRLYGSQMRAVRIQARYQPLLEAVPVLGQVGILALGGWLALNGSISLGTFLAFSTYIAKLMAPSRQLAGMLTIAQQARAGVERIFQLLDLQPTVVDAPDAIELDERPGAISFDHVTFAYPGGAPVLDDFSLTIRPGEKVALVGASGSGKSTAGRLLTRFYDPDAGAVTIGGRDARGVQLASLRHRVGMAFEDAFLFSESVRDNIAYGAPDATDEQIEQAARAARAHEFITALPHGYDTVVGERGLSLSGGQRQRVALARAILRDPAILVLDDATSAVDARTEQTIHDALRSVMQDRTVLLIAHRHSTLHLADRIVVLEGGRIVAEGSHDELIDASPTYRALFGDGEVPDEAPDEPVRSPSSGSPSATAVRIVVPASSAVASAPPATHAVQAPSLGMGLGGSSGGGGLRGSLAPTPQLLAQVEKLPPIVDHADLDLAHESLRRSDFSLGALLREFRRPLLFALVFVVLDALAGLLGPAIVKTGIDEGVVTGTAHVLFAASALYLVIALGDMITGMAESFISGRVAQRIMLSLRVRVFAQLQRLSLDYYEREMAGRIMTRMTTDIDQFESLLQNGLLGALVAGVTFVGVAVALVVVDAPLGLAVLSIIIPLALATVWFRRRASRLYDLARERIAVVNAAFQESLAGVRESQAFTHEHETMRTFHGHGAAYLRSRVAAQRLVAIYFPFVQFLSAIADVIVLGLGASLIAHGQLTAGALIAFLLYIDMFFSPIQQLSQVFDAWQQTRVSVARIAELMRLDTLTPDADHPRPVDALAGDIHLDDVHFAYPTEAVSSRLRGPRDVKRLAEAAPVARPTEALGGVELGIRPGETVALVGETGAGKSTVMKLIARFYDPDRGAVRADGADLRTLDLAGYRARLGYVPQESFLFTGTIGENIAYGRPDATADDVARAARAVGAEAMITALPDGYATAISERGTSLSTGQRQLIALARAELVDPAILLLDEATSNLDLASETRVTEAMHRLARDRTTVIIAHRLQTAMGADRILMLSHGRVVEHGTHDELLAADGAYAAMWRAFELTSSTAG